ncbi:MAG: hypothetical protein A2X08_04180 [Bacteroidetes bacterium GWA2_32_17]|nr:MAG: hypothetical protein A2X08_04180 [Bacteroidetes bacterium GWA2_32_17]
MKSKLFIILIFTSFIFISSVAQSLSYEDLINLQKNDLAKANGFFDYKRWTLNKGEDIYRFNTYQDKNNYYFQYTLIYSGNSFYLGAISYDMTRWGNDKAEQAQYLHKKGYENVIIYNTDSTHFAELENETKKYLNKFASKTESNGDEITIYRGDDNEIQFIYYTWPAFPAEDEQYLKFSSAFEIYILNYLNIYKIINNEIHKLLCRSCGGKGKIGPNDKNQYVICTSCNGSGLSELALAAEIASQDSIRRADSLAAAEAAYFDAAFNLFIGKWSEDGTVNKEVFDINMVFSNSDEFHIELKRLYSGTKTEWDANFLNNELIGKLPNDYTGKNTILKIEDGLLHITNLYGKNLILKKINN